MKPGIISSQIRILLSSLSILASLSSFNQVTYYDIDPDTTISENNGFYNFDFINDDSVEFQIHLRYTPPNNVVSIKVQNDSCFVSGYIFEDCYEAIRFILNDTINAVDTTNYFWSWYHHPSFHMALTAGTTCSAGTFLGKNDVYIGLKWIDNSIPYVCWVRVDVAEDASWFTVKDYAYGSYTVIAGLQTSTFQDEIVERDYYQVLRNENNIIVKTKNGMNLKQCKLLNLLSHEFPIILKNNEVIIDNQKLTPGLYLLYLSTDQGANTIKILIN